MKKIAILILAAALLLTACSQQATPTASDSEMATKIAQILTNMPTATGQGPKVATATAGLPTVAATGTKAATSAPNTAAPSPAAPSATVAPTVAPTKAPTTAATPTGAGSPSPTTAATATKSAVTGTAPAATATSTRSATTAPTPSGPTATPAAGDPRATLGTPTWRDPMDRGDNWPTGDDPAGFTDIAFQNGSMELTGLKPIDGWRLTSEKIGNVYLEMTVNTGSCLPQDRYGFIARVPALSEANRGYLFGFTCDGKFSLRKWDGTSNSMTNFIAWKTHTAINAGANKVNRLGVMMKGNKLSIYANGVLLGEVLDNSWLEGSFGIFAGAHESSQYTLKVDEVVYWKVQ